MLEKVKPANMFIENKYFMELKTEYTEQLLMMEKMIGQKTKHHFDRDEVLNNKDKVHSPATYNKDDDNINTILDKSRIKIKYCCVTNIEYRNHLIMMSMISVQAN